jgi:hypothetical protein
MGWATFWANFLTNSSGHPEHEPSSTATRHHEVGHFKVIIVQVTSAERNTLFAGLFCTFSVSATAI